MTEKHNNILKASLVSALVSFSIFFYSPLALYINNYAEWSFDMMILLPLLLGMSAVGTALLCIIIVKSGVYFSRVITIICGIGVLIWLQNNLFSWNSGVLNGKSLDWNQSNMNSMLEIAVWTIILGLCIWKYQHICKHTHKIALFLLALQSVFIIQLSSTIPFQSCKHFMLDYEETYSFSTNKNIVIVLLDAFQTDVFKKIIDEDARYKSMFDGFKYYADTLSGQPTTNPSIELILTGQFYKNEQPIEEFIKASFSSETSIPKVLTKNGYQVSLPIDSTVYCSSETANQQPKNLSTAIDAGELETFAKVMALQLLPSTFKNIYYQNNIDSFQSKAQNYFFTDNASFIHELKTRATVKESRPTFKFYHLQGSHLPFIINEELMPERMPLSGISYERQSKAALKTAYQLLIELKKMAIYDQTMILIMGDHGNQDEAEQLIHKPAGMFEFNIPYLKSRPLLLIKPFNSHGDLEENYTEASLVDITSTIYAALAIPNKSTGINLLDKNNEQHSRNRYFYNYQGWSENKHFFTTMKEFKVNGPSDQLTSWEQTNQTFSSSGKIIEPIPPIAFNTPLFFNKNYPENFPYLQKGWDTPESDQIGTKAANVSLLLPVPTDAHALQIAVDTRPFLTDTLTQQRVNIFINNELISHATLNATTTSFSFNVPQTAIKAKKVYLTFNLPDSNSPRELGINNDTRKLSIGLKKLLVNPKN